MKILLCMCLLSKHLVGEGTVTILRNKNIKEREAPIDFLFFSELNGRRLTVEMIEEAIQFLLAMRPNDIGVIHIPFPELWQEPGRT